MTDVDARTLGERIRAARERAGMSQADLGAGAGIERTAVNKIESGTRRVTALELSDIARTLDVQMASFFADPIPALVSHRSSQGLDTADSQIDRLLANLASEVELANSLAPKDLGLTTPTGLPYAQPSSNSEAEQLAGTTRGMLGLSPNEPATDLVALAAKIGLLAFSVDLGVDTADAGTILLRQGGVTLVNSHNKVGRRRLALAHELGHYLVADEYTVDWRVAEHRGSSDIEARLDRFARALLMPEPALRKTWAHHTKAHETRESAVLTASEFRVDMATLARRLRETDVIDRDEAALIRTVSTTQTDIVEFGLLVPTDLAGTSLPTPFIKAVLRMFRDERISRERALDMLQDTFSDADLPERRPRREDELWTYVS